MVTPEEIEVFLQEIESVNPTMVFKRYRDQIFIYEGSIPFGTLEGARLSITCSDTYSSYNDIESFSTLASVGDFVKLVLEDGTRIEFTVPEV
jgi:hypothetical protein